ncbi:MAG: hypothetical protein ACM3N4_06025, partial [Nitrososphaerota archaeon]
AKSVSYRERARVSDFGGTIKQRKFGGVGRLEDGTPLLEIRAADDDSAARAALIALMQTPPEFF